METEEKKEKKIVVARKLEIYPVAETKEEVSHVWNTVRHLSNMVFIAANNAISELYLNYEIQKRLLEYPKRVEEIDFLLLEESTTNAEKKELIKEKKLLTSEHGKATNEAYKAIHGVKKEQISWRLIRKKFPELSTVIVDPLNMKVSQDFSNDLSKVLSGEKSPRRYKRGLPIPFRATAISFFDNEEQKKVLVNIKNMTFAIKFGRDRGSRYSEMLKVINNEDGYSFGDSQIKYDKKKNKIFLLLTLKHPLKSAELVEENTLKVTAGITIPVRCEFGKETRYFGDANDLMAFRLQFQRRYRSLQKHMKESRGGHGRKRKMKGLDRLLQTESKYILTYNHRLSKMVVEMALKNRCKNIVVEQISSDELTEEEQKFQARNWAGFQLSELITYKAKIYGINTEIIKDKAEIEKETA